MTEANASTAQLDISEDQERDLLALLREVDTAELKLTIPQASHRSTIGALEIDPLDAQIRQVYFFDTPDLQLDAAGVVVRARRVQGRADDTVVKLRPVKPSELPAELRSLPEFGVEVDAMPHGRHVCSASLTGKTKKVRDVVAAGADYRKLFSKRQRRFYAEHAPAGIALDDLAVLGPIFVLKAKVEPSVLGRRLVAEFWLYPSGEGVLELSTKCPPKETWQTALEVRQYLVDNSVDITGEQQTKTRTALEYFSAQLTAAGL